MHQLVEGFDNEVTFICLFITLLLVVVIPMYVFKPRRLATPTQEQQQGEQQQNVQIDERLDVLNEHIQPLLEESFSTSSPINKGSHENVETHESGNTPSHNSSRSPSDSSADGEMITIRVIHNETSQEYTVGKDMTLIDLKKKCFPMEFENNEIIRLIYSGRILNGDTYPLRYLGVLNGSVLHAVVSSRTSNAEPSTTNSTTLFEEIDLSEYLVPLVSVMGLGCWLFVMLYPGTFSATSLTILLILTILFTTFMFYS